MGNDHESADYNASSASSLRPLLTINATCAVLDISRPTLYRLMKAGQLRSVRVGTRPRFRPEDIEAYLKRDEKAAGEKEVNPAPAAA